ncbi:DUF305 domain-containing protein [Streptomyces beijiangensis]|uniref:DUF305 domain-containing protein n=1 Tax=Streptomyces beijiangensis TaxID=163361 RepID=A0A939F9R5_9ACTN|nr:DUF305 domain-containing protein [Streptomyces beijiangensis]MBO0514259.1 DUF305 domain-containing protein [Streptomyces beijiangensis]
MTKCRKYSKRIAFAATVAAGGLLLAGCGGSDSKPKAAAATAAAADFNDADVMFAQMMIPHHQQALEMAELADGRASDPEITSMAGAIEKAQDPEIRTMTSWLKGWGKPVSASGMDHGMSGMSGMMSAQDMTRLKAAKGTAFDRKFAELMIGHHEGAVAMARTEQKDGRDAGAVAMAGDVVTAQSAEVARLRTILNRL